MKVRRGRRREDIFLSLFFPIDLVLPQSSSGAMKESLTLGVVWMHGSMNGWRAGQRASKKG